MPLPWATLGMQAGGQAAGGIMGLLFDTFARKAQLKQAKKMQQLELSGQQQMTDYNMQRQIEMWEKTGPVGMMKQIKQAGLSPGLMYGMGGAGGQTANVETGKVTGQQAQQGTGAMMGMEMGSRMAEKAMTLEIMKAQKENIEADTANKERDRVGKGIQQEGQVLDNARKEIDIRLQSIEEEVQGKTQNARIAMYKQELEASMKRLEMLREKAGVNKEQLDLEVANSTAELLNKAMDIEVKQAGINLSYAQIRQIDKAIWKMTQDVMQGWEGLGIQDIKTVLEKNKQEWEQSGLPPMIRDILGAVGTGVLTGMILQRIPAGGRNEVKGFKVGGK